MPDPVDVKIVEMKYKPDIIEHTEEEVRRGILEGESFLVLEMQVVGTVDSARSGDPLLIRYLAVCNKKVLITPWMQDKIEKFTIICKKTVMNLKPNRLAGLTPLVKEHDNQEICLYRLSARMFIDEDGTKKWILEDKIDPALMEVDALAPKKGEAAKEWAKEVLDESPLMAD